MKKNWLDVYEEFAKNYQEPIAQSGYTVDGVSVNKSAFDKWFEIIQSKFDVQEHHYLIDVGCGSGVFLNYFAQKTTHLYGVDASIAQLNNAKKNCPVAQLIQGDVLNFGFVEFSFDRLFCNSVFLLFDSLLYAEKVLEYFLSRTTADAKIWIGDLPAVNELVDSNFRRKSKTNNLYYQHYPEYFFFDFCQKHNLQGEVVRQDIENKESAKYRYDFLITKS
ncbi:MAG: class I SAM-dependent methyltransferase [Raineya sp.]|nr:class I SAM-dependent methyltransferase [Raineya sp.]MDW8295477.1 class I SAM-dependent methyltransferase [Raineya sp.]